MKQIEELSNQELKLKQERCRRMGAESFQKVVFAIESVKYTVIDRCFPNIRNWYDKRCEKMMNKCCKKTNDLEKQQQIVMQYQKQRLLFRKELAQRKNRNYHFDKRNPYQTVQYLKRNKRIHQNGIVAGVTMLGLSGIGICFSSGIFHTLAVGWFVLASVKCFVDMQCINLQNYNLCRLQRIMPRLETLQKKQLQVDSHKYGQISSVVYQTIKTDVKFPEPEHIVKNLSNRKQLLQMKSLLLETMDMQHDKKSTHVKHYRKEGC